MASGSTVKKIAKIVAAVLTSSVLMATGSAAIASTTSSDISIAQAQPLLMVPNTTNVSSWHSSHSSHSSHRQLPAFFYSLPRGSLKTATVA